MHQKAIMLLLGHFTTSLAACFGLFSFIICWNSVNTYDEFIGWGEPRTHLQWGLPTKHGWEEKPKKQSSTTTSVSN
jgi:hypothetical protein